MGLQKIPAGERIASSFKKLAASSTELNVAADQLAKSISKLEATLASLKLGISAWHTIASDRDEDGNYWSRDIGYTELGKKWGIAVRRVVGNHDLNEHEKEVWFFSDAPRWMCIESVAKIPDLLDELVKRATETTEKLKARRAEADDLAKAITKANDELSPF